jgi:hypothetical protein
MRRTLALAAAGCAALTLPAPAAAQEEVLARVDRPTPIAAHDGVVAWSARDPATDRYRLVVRADGVTAPLPIPTRSVPFDVDLGPTASGGVVAVYSRCRTDPPNSVQMVRGRGCDIYEYDFARATERRVPGVNSTGASEAWPSFHRPRLAFARLYDRKRDYPYLYVNDLSDARGSIRMPGGQRKTCRRGRCTDDRRSEPFELELYGRRLAFSWRYTDFAEGFAYDLRLDDVRARDGDPRRLAKVGGGGLTGVNLGWPAFESGRVYWSQACYGDTAGCPGRRFVARSTYVGDDLEQTRFDPRARVFGHDRDGGFTYYLRDTFGPGGGTECRGDPDVPGGTCELVRAVPSFG